MTIIPLPWYFLLSLLSPTTLFHPIVSPSGFSFFLAYVVSYSLFSCSFPSYVFHNSIAFSDFKIYFLSFLYFLYFASGPESPLVYSSSPNDPVVTVSFHLFKILYTFLLICTVFILLYQILWSVPFLLSTPIYIVVFWIVSYNILPEFCCLVTQDLHLPFPLFFVYAFCFVILSYSWSSFCSPFLLLFFLLFNFIA